MFRWLESLVARLPRSRDAADKWVEPSNAITRAIMAASFAPLMAEPVVPAAAEVTTEVEAPVPAEVEAPAAPKEEKRKRVAA